MSINFLKILRRLWKITGITLVGLLVVTLGAATAIYFGLNAILEERRSEIESAISEFASMPLAVESIEGRLYPTLYIAVKGISAYPSEDCRKVLTVAEGDFSVAWIPLLSGRIEATAVEVSGLRLIDSTENHARCKREREAVSARIRQSEAKAIKTTSSSVELKIEKIAVRDAVVDVQGSRFEVPDLTAALVVQEKHLLLSGLKGHAKIGSTRLLLTKGSIERAEDLSIDGLTVVSESQKGSVLLSAKLSKTGMHINSKLIDVDIEEVLSILRKVAGITFKTRFTGRANGQTIIDIEGASGTRVEGYVSVRNVRVLDGSIEYAATTASVKGSLAVTKAGAKGSGTSSIKGFLFKSGNTRVYDTDAELRKIVLNAPRKGDTVVTLDLDGTACQVEHPQVKVSRAVSIKAPLRIVVPARAGYSVSGSVSVQGVTVEPTKYPLQDVAGTVDTLVSDTLNRFRTRDLAFSYQNDRGKLAAEYTMSSKLHEMSSAQVSFPWGAIDGSARLDRGAGQQFSAALIAKNVDLTGAHKLLSTWGFGDVSGTIEHARLNVRGVAPHPLDSLSGDGSLTVIRGGIGGFNFTRALRQALSVLPGVRPPDDDVKVTQRMTMTFSLANSAADIRALQLQNERYTFNAIGTLAFDGAIKLRGAVVFLRE
jgi:hypothetical protein